MTGFARVDGAHDGKRWSWEIKSVNGRNLEARFRMPPGFDGLEPELRKALQQKVKRGSVNAGLILHDDGGEPQYRINEAALENAIAMVKSVQSRLDCAPPRPEGLLALRGVIEPADGIETEERRAALGAALAASFREGVDKLAAVRDVEGAAMSAVLSAQFDEVERLTTEAASMAAATPEVLRAKVAAQLEELLAGAGVPEERLAQEAALLAVKADVREELDRLATHVAAGRALLKEKEPVGRQLDFLTQEFNREANTLCSKAQDMALKRIGLELKKVIDQLREQVQNIE